MSSVASVNCQINCKIYKNLNCIPFIKKNITLKKKFFKIFFLNFIYESVLCQVFHLNENTVSTEIMTNKKFSLKNN